MGADGTTASGRLEGQVAIVTGGASGIGAEVVRRFAAEGARQVVVGLPEEEARATALVDEHPDAYKDIRQVMADQADLVVRSFADELVDIQADRDLGIANVFEENGGFLGKGLFLKGASKTVRMLTLRDEEIDEPFFLRRFRRALSVRTRINPNVAYRLINAESEGLPGLIVDRYGDYLVAQIRHPALEEKKPQIISALRALYEGGIRGIFERSDFESTPEYRLNRHSGVLWGEVPEETTVWVDGIAYLIRFKTGQKTGLFLDQQASRAKARQLIRTYHLEGQPASDLLCYTGGFSFT